MLAEGAASLAAAGPPRRQTVAFACLSETGVRLEGLGFTGSDVRTSFELAARSLPLDLLLYDNERDPAKTLANVDDAIRRKADLYIQYCDDAQVNLKAGEKLKAAGIPVLAINYPVPGAALYAADNAAAGKIAGEALISFAAANWRGAALVAAIVGDLSAKQRATDERAEGVAAALRQKHPGLPITRLDCGPKGFKMDSVLPRYLSLAAGKKVLLATLDDASALSAKDAIEAAGRTPDCIIVSQGLDRTMHGGARDKKEISPDNRGSVILGSVAYFIDRYGYEVLPLALRLLQGEAVAATTSTKHVLVTASNVYTIYPPTDMN